MAEPSREAPSSSSDDDDDLDRFFASRTYAELPQARMESRAEDQAKREEAALAEIEGYWREIADREKLQRRRCEERRQREVADRKELERRRREVADREELERRRREFADGKEHERRQREVAELEIIQRRRREIVEREIESERLRVEEEAALSAAIAASLTISAAAVPETITPTEDDDDRGLCKICLDAGIGVVFLPCGHACACAECATRVKRCPICRSVFASVPKIYLS